MPNSERELPQGWAWTTLGEATHVNQRNRAIRELPDSHPVSFVPMAAVDAEAGIIAMPEQRTLGQVRKGFTPFSDRDVIMAKITPSMENGKAAIARGLTNGIGFGSTEFHVFTPTDIVLPEYVFHFVRQESFRRDAKANFAGTAGQLRVPAAFLEKYPFPLAPLPEQRRIVAKIEELFSRLDAGVAALKRVQAALKRYKASVLKAACEGRLVPQDPSDEPADVLLTRILAERRAQWEEDLRAKGKAPKKAGYDEPADIARAVGLPDIPTSWTWASLEQLTSSVRVICYGILMPKEHVPNGVPYVKVKDMKGDRLDPSSLTRTSPEIAAQYARASLMVGDLLLAIRGTYGRVVEVPPELEGGNITQDTARLALCDSRMTQYLAWWLRSEDCQTYFKRVARGVAVKGVNIADVRLTPVAVPPLHEQGRIVAEVERRFSVIAHVELAVANGLTRATRMRQAILFQAYSGALVPQGSVGT